MVIGKARAARARGHVEAREVLAHHAAAVVYRQQRHDRALGHADPLGRETHDAALVVERDHAVLEDLVQRAALLEVAAVVVEGLGGRLYAPAVAAAITARP